MRPKEIKSNNMFLHYCLMQLQRYEYYKPQASKEKQSNWLPLPQQGDRSDRQIPLNTTITTTKTRLFKYMENSDSFHISEQNIDCGYSLEPPRRGGSYECPQSMFLSKNKKNNVYPCKLQFCYTEVGFKGVKII